MSKIMPQFRWSLTFAILFTLGTLAASTSAIQAQTTLNVVYVESNIGSTPNSNSVFGFSNNGSGVLTALPDSPYLTDGTGVYQPGGANGEFAADQQLIISPSSRILVAVNGDSNTFSTMQIHGDGHLSLISTVGSNGSDPVSFGFLYNLLSGPSSWLGVVNKGADPNQEDGAPNISQFKLTYAGKAGLISSKGTVTLNTGTSPSQLLSVAGKPGSNQYWAFLDQYQSGGSSNPPGIYSYKVMSTGALTLVNSASGPADPPTLGLASNPTYRVLYAGFPSLNEVGIFTYNVSTGQVTYSSEVANPGSGVGWLAVSPSGHYLYTAEANSGTVTVYQIKNSGTSLVEGQHFRLSGTGASAGNLAFDPTGAFLYCLDNVHSTLHVLNINSSTGFVSEPNAPTVLNEPVGEEALGLATFLIQTAN